MKNLTLSLLAFASAMAPAFAGLRSPQEANLAARRFMNEHLGRVADLRAIEVAEDAPYYLYNEANGLGFVMLSKSDRLRPVLAYSDSHSLSLDAPDLPDGLRAWLEWVDEATETLEEYPEAALSAAQQAATPIAPLLGQIAWNQDAPFNNLCPSLATGGRCATGCVATGMAQTIYYHRYPEQGQGSHSYTEYTGRHHSVNFANQTYDYNLMYDKYTRQCTAEQNAEVAKLNYHCGVSVDMSYGEQSGSFEFRVRKAMVDNFGYDPLAQLCYRDRYTYDEWQTLLIRELENQRPIVFFGQSSEGGHCFILDGINQQGLYHVNWGWGGYYNGYFDVSILNPEGVGIGATESETGFSSGQSAMVQLGPNGQLTGDVNYMTALRGNKLSCPTNTVALGNTISMKIDRLENYSTDDVAGKVGYLWTQNGERVAYAPCKTINVQAASYYIYNTSISGTVTIPTTLADGEYKVYAYFQPSSGAFKDSLAILHFFATEASYLTCTVANQKATFDKDSYSSNLKEHLVASDWSYDNVQYETGYEQTVTCTLTNNTGSTFCGQYSLRFADPHNAYEYAPAEEIVTLADGESRTVTFKYIFDMSGTWSSDLYFTRQNIDDQRVKINNTHQTFEIAKGTELTLLAEPILLQEYYDRNGQGKIGFYVENTGANYSGPLQVQFLTSKTATKATLTFESDVQIAAGAKDTLVVTGTLSGLTAMKKYYVTGLYYRAGEFTKFNAADGITNFTQIAIYKEGQHTDAIEEILSDQLSELKSSIFLPKGIYVKDGKKVLMQE